MSFFTDKHSFSAVSILHYQKLLYRGLLLVLGIAVYVYARITDQVSELFTSPVAIVALTFIWVIMAVEMISRLVPSPVESMGCEKQFDRNLIRTEVPEPMLQSKGRTIAVAAVWAALNLTLGILHIFGIIDTAIMLLICAFYALSDMISILFFCPFQTWIMKNKCCGTCRIYNWDYFMMCTPLIFIPTLPSYSLLALSIVVVVVWEYRVRKHPERFSEATNASLSCKNCPEKLCKHKKQLASYLEANKTQLQEKGEFLTERLRHEIALRQQNARETAEKATAEMKGILQGSKRNEGSNKPEDAVDDVEKDDK